MSKKAQTEREVTFEIKEHIGVIGTSLAGWKKELNVISWNNGNNIPKFDLRAWDEDHTHMSRGITLTKDELKALKELLSKINI